KGVTFSKVLDSHPRSSPPDSKKFSTASVISSRSGWSGRTAQICQRRIGVHVIQLLLKATLREIVIRFCFDPEVVVPSRGVSRVLPLPSRQILCPASLHDFIRQRVSNGVYAALCLRTAEECINEATAIPPLEESLDQAPRVARVATSSPAR